MRVIFHPEFPRDQRKFEANYGEISPALADRFREEIDGAIAAIKAVPSGAGHWDRMESKWHAAIGICPIRHIQSVMPPVNKPLAWLHGEIKTPPFSREARLEAGVLLRRLQGGESIGLPHSRPMPSVGAKVHELRIIDEAITLRIVYAIAADAIVILEVFSKRRSRQPRP